MQTVIGRLTKDAVIRELTDGRKLVSFTIAENSRYKLKGSDEVKQATSFFDCAYWMGTAIAAHLKKGMLVETCGRVGLNVWNNTDGETKASLTLHVQFIQLHGQAKTNVSTESKVIVMTESPETPVKDDLPF